MQRIYEIKTTPTDKGSSKRNIFNDSCIKTVDFAKHPEMNAIFDRYRF